MYTMVGSTLVIQHEVFLDHTVLFSIKCKTTVNIIYLNDVSRNICTRWLVDVINFHYCVNSIAL